MKLLSKALNRSVWCVLSLFFAIAFIITLVGEVFIRENENNINYALGINTYTSVTDDTVTDSEYFKSDYYKSDGKTYDDKAMREGSMEISRTAAADGAVLLWNNGNALPLVDGERLSFFGVSCKPKNWFFTGHGSGRVSVTVTDFPDLKAQFESENKFTVNPTLWNSYSNTQAYGMFSPHADDNHYREFSVNEKAWSAVKQAAGNSFAAYGDAAVYFISRTGAEDGDTWYDTSINTNDGNVDDNYLDLTANEKATIEALVQLKDSVFKKVILVLNTGTPFQMKTLSEYDIDACLWVGMGGNASYAAVYDVMSGNVNPSGRLVDTYAYDGDSAPSSVNTGAFEFEQYGGLPTENRSSNAYNHAYIVYQEGIYVGYRYYETRYEDTVTGNGNAKDKAGTVNGNDEWRYSETVKFPFGHGLSYTTFDYTAFDVKPDGDKYVCSVTVKNTGATAGRHTVQIYLQKPYTDYDKQNGIEKAAVELVGYAKTDVIEPGDSRTVTVAVDKYEFKTYDAYGQKTYILEKGDYYLAVGRDAHDALNNILAAKGFDAADGMVDIYGEPVSGDKARARLQHIKADDFTKYSVSPNGERVTNQFSNADINLYRGTSDQSVTYLSRNDWAGTYPKSYYKMQARNRILVKDMQYYTKITADPDAAMPIYDRVTSPTGKLSLIMLKDMEYDHEMWGYLLDQLTWDETVALCGIGNHVISAASSVNSPEVTAHDGPAGVKNDTPAELDTFMAFPCGVLLASTFDDALVQEVGNAFGLEMLHAGVGEIYGTGAGIHRSVYGGRNWEYFSEDGFISGKILAAEVRGLQSKGAIVNIKHLVLNDQEIYRCGVTTWANEQSIREIYLKAFEAAVTEGKANGVMSSLNRIGATWAGKHKGLLTEVLRNEWGFVGLVETDAATGLYMREGGARANAVIAGNDLWLRGTNNASELWGDYKSNATVCAALRESCHRILYTVLHSSAMNGFNSSTRLVYVAPWYYGALTAGQIVTGIFAFLCIGMAVASFVLPVVLGKKKNKGEAQA